MPPCVPTLTSPQSSSAPHVTNSVQEQQQNLKSKSKLNGTSKDNNDLRKNGFVSKSNVENNSGAFSKNVNNRNVNNVNNNSRQKNNSNRSMAKTMQQEGQVITRSKKEEQEVEKQSNQVDGTVGTEQNDNIVESSLHNSQQMMMGGAGGMGMGMGMGYGFGGMGMGMGYGGYGGFGMSPYSSYGMGMGMGMGGPLQGLNQFLFGFQSVIFSLGQAMQVRKIKRN